MIQELQYYLTRVDCGDFGSNTLGSNVSVFPDLTDLASVDVFLMSIPDANGIGFSMQVRKKLFALFPHFNLIICDLGCLKIGNSLSDTLHSYYYVSEQIRQLGKALIILDTLCFVELLNFSHQKCAADKTVILNNSFSYPAFSADNLNLLSFANESTVFIGLQNFLSPQDDYSLAAENNVIIYRLGEVIEHTKTIEPVLRDAANCFISLAVLERSSDFKVTGGSLNGVSTHNLCQLYYYMGRSDSMKCLIVDGNSFCRMGSEGFLTEMIALNVWHFMLGRSQILSFNKSVNSYKSYYISNFHDNVDFCFYEDLALKIWWLEVIIGSSTAIIGASYEDYKRMQDGEIPKLVAHLLSKK